MRNIVLRISCFSFFIVSTQITIAQTTEDTVKTANKFKPSWFLAVGIGIGSPGLASTMQLNIETKKRTIYSVGMTSVYDEHHEAKNVNSVFVQLGTLTKSEIAFSRWGLGPSFSKVTIYEDDYSGKAKQRKNGVGVHFSLQAILAENFAGIGATAFFDLNTVNSHAGFLLIIALGRINKKS